MSELERAYNLDEDAFVAWVVENKTPGFPINEKVIEAIRIQHRIHRAGRTGVFLTFEEAERYPAQPAA